MPLTREAADKILQRNLANILAKLQAGRTLTASERALIETEAGVSTTDTSSAFAKNWDDLAARLSISRRGLLKVRHRFADLLPESRPDGRHDVAAWKRFFGLHGINASAIDAEPPGDEDELLGTSEAEWRKRELREKVTKLQIQNARERRALIPLEELQDRLPAMLMAFNTALNNFSSRAAQKLEGVEKFDEILEILEAEVDVLKKTFADCPFLDEQPVEIESSDANLPPNGKPPQPASEPFDKQKLSREQKKPQTKPSGSNPQPKSQARKRTAPSRPQSAAGKAPNRPKR